MGKQMAQYGEAYVRCPDAAFLWSQVFASDDHRQSQMTGREIMDCDILVGMARDYGQSYQEYRQMKY